MMELQSLKRGQLVISKAGRDRFRMFLVQEVIDEDYVLLVDGKLRPLEKPKRKKIRHLAKTNHMSDCLDSVHLNNALVRKEILKYQPNEEE